MNLVGLGLRVYVSGKAKGLGTLDSNFQSQSTGEI